MDPVECVAPGSKVCYLLTEMLASISPRKNSAPPGGRDRFRRSTTTVSTAGR